MTAASTRAQAKADFAALSEFRVGLVSRSDLIKASLTLHEEEHQRQAFRRIRLRSDRTRA